MGAGSGEEPRAWLTAVPLPLHNAKQAEMGASTRGAGGARRGMNSRLP